MTDKRKPGRPRTGKKSNPKYTHITGYIQKSTNAAARHFLVDNEEFKDTGDLLDAALIEFLAKRNYINKKKSTWNRYADWFCKDYDLRYIFKLFSINRYLIGLFVKRNTVKISSLSYEFLFMSRQLTPKKLLILSTIVSNPRISSPKISLLIGSTQSNVNRVLWELCSHAYITVTTEGKHRLVALYEPTMKGKETVRNWCERLMLEQNPTA